MTPTAATASYSLVELGGILGAAASGPLTDHCVDRARLSALALAVLAVLVGVGLPHAGGSALPLVLGATGAALTVPKVSLPLLARSELLPLAVMGTSGAVSGKHRRTVVAETSGHDPHVAKGSLVATCWPGWREAMKILRLAKLQFTGFAPGQQANLRGDSKPPDVIRR